MSAADLDALMREAFDAWARGERSVFDLLADDVRWTITGTSPLAGTYTSREQFLAEVIGPLSQRLRGPIRPTVRSILADDDTVVVVWDGEATAADGRPYDNSYCWVMRVVDERIVEATAFFDSLLLADLWARVDPEPG